MSIAKLLCDDGRNPERGPRVARRMEGTGEANGARTKKSSMQGQEGGSTPAKKKPRTHSRTPRGPTQAPLRA